MGKYMEASEKTSEHLCCNTSPSTRPVIRQPQPGIGETLSAPLLCPGLLEDAPVGVEAVLQLSAAIRCGRGAFLDDMQEVFEQG